MAASRFFQPLACIPAVALIVVVAGCGGAHSRFTSHLQRGQQYLAADNLDKASVEFRNAAQIEPRNAQAMYYNGRIAEVRGNIREAYGFYQAAVEADGAFAAARAGAGRMLVFAGAAKRALELVSPGLTAHPDDPDLLAVRAAAHQQLEEYEAARADAEKAVKVAPANENAVAVLAASYTRDKDYPSAIQLVNAALGNAPQSIQLREVLTNLYLVGGEPVKAEEQMREIIELEPGKLAPRSQLAVHMARSHNLDGAQRVLTEAVEAFSKRKQATELNAARMLLVDFVSRERSREQGEKTLRDFIAREPDNYDLRLGLGALLQRTGASDEAVETYRQVVQRDGTGPKGLLARDRMAAIEADRGHADAAQKWVAEVLEKNPRDDDALIVRAALAMKHADPTSAIADLRAVLRDQPGSAALQRNLAAAYLAKGQTALAEGALRAAMRAAPTDVAIRIELAQLLARTDRGPQGVALLEETVQAMPDSSAAHEALLGEYIAAGNLQAARTAAEALESSQPQSAAGFFYAGLVAAREKRLDVSQSNLETALRLQPDRMEVLGALVQVEVARKDYAGAIAVVQQALDKAPGNVDLINLSGELYFAKQDLGRATELFQRASAKDPRQWRPHENLAHVKFAQHDPTSAAAEYQTALKLNPGDIALVADAARFYEQQGHIDEAIAAYEGLYAQNKQAQQFAANNLAMLLVNHKTDPTSLDRARELTNSFTTSQNGVLLDTVGWVRFKRGEYKDALASLERAADRAPDSRVIRYHLGMVQLQLGLRDRARSNLESALNGASSFQGVDEARTALANLKTKA